MNITWVTGHLEIYNRFLECFTPDELKAWGQEVSAGGGGGGELYIFSLLVTHIVF